MTTVLKYSANEIIEDAFLDSGIIPPDQVPEAEDVATGFRILNRLLKLWQVNMHLWLQEEGVIFLNPGQQSYLLGPDGDEATDLDNFITSQLSTPPPEGLTASQGDTDIFVDSTEGMQAPVDLLTVDPIDADLWTPLDEAVVSVNGDELVVTNGGNLSGSATFILELVSTVNSYRVRVNNTSGDGEVVTFSIRDPNQIDTGRLILSTGTNSDGQLGTGNLISESVFTGEATLVDSWETIAAGDMFSLAVTKEGTLWGVGDNDNGQLGQDNITSPTLYMQESSGATDWKSVSGGSNFSVALKTDGTLWSSGSNTVGQLGTANFDQSLVYVQEESKSTDWASIACGKDYAMAIKTDGTLWGVGDNSLGQLGVGSTTDQVVFVEETGLARDWASVGTGKDFTMAVDSSGKLWATGDNTKGQLGIGATPVQLDDFTQVGTDEDWSTVACGDDFSFAIKTDNFVYSTGNNSEGQLALGTSQDQNTFQVALEEKADYKMSASGNEFSMIIRLDGTLWATGLNDNGQFGNNTTTSTDLYTQIGSDTDWEFVACGFDFTMAIKTDGTLYGTGDNSNGQLGDNSTTQRLVFTQENTGATNWATVACGISFTIALTDLNTLYGTGQNNNGQLGDDTTTQRLIFTQESSSDADWALIDTGRNFTMALKSDGTMWGTGLNSSNQLGLGTSSNVKVFTQGYLPVNNELKSISISLNGSFSAVIKSDGTLWSAGDNSSGQLGLGTTTSTIIYKQESGNDTDWDSVKAGENFMMALKSDGTLWGTGLNTSGQLGAGGFAVINTFTQEVTSSTWDSFDVSDEVSFAIDGDNKLFVTGNASEGVLSRYKNLSTVNSFSHSYELSKGIIASAAGSEFLMFIKSDGTLWGVGKNGEGQLGIGNINSPITLALQESSKSTNWVDVRCGSDFSVAMKSDGTLWGTGRRDQGQFGQPNGTDISDFTQEPLLDTDWLTFDCGDSHTMAVKTDNKMYGTGRNANGQLGINSTTNQFGFVSAGSISWIRVACGLDHTIAIGTSHDLYGTGSNAAGQLGNGTTTQSLVFIKESSEDTDWSGDPNTITAGNNFSIALRINGHLYGSGDNSIGQFGIGAIDQVDIFTQENTGAEWLTVSAGNDFSLAVSAAGIDGDLFATGNNAEGQLGLGHVGGTRNVYSLVVDKGGVQYPSAGFGFSAFHEASSEQRLFTVGSNNHGQLGDGITDGRASFIQTAIPIVDARSVAGGSTFAIHVKTDNTLWGTGQNQQGQLGIVTSGLQELYIQEGTLATNWSFSACGNQHTMAIKNGGTLYGTGENSSGQLGAGNTNAITAFTQESLQRTNWSDVTCGINHTIAIISTNLIFGTGSNIHGQLSLSIGTSSVNIFTEENTNRINWNNIEAGGNSTFASSLSDNGLVTGSNLNGVLGTGEGGIDKLTFSTTFLLDAGAIGIGCGSDYSMVITQDDTLWGVGDGTKGQIGNTTDNSIIIVQESRKLTDWKQVFCGDDFTVALNSSSELYSTGDGGQGQLGVTTTNSPTFIQEATKATDWSQVAPGNNFSSAVKSNGFLSATGSNIKGQLGIPSIQQTFVYTDVHEPMKADQVACGAAHAMVVQSDDTVWGTGRNTLGQLGLNTNASVNIFTQESGEDTDWDQVACGEGHSMAIKTDDKLYGTGSNSNGQLGTGDEVNTKIFTQEVLAASDWDTVSCGSNHSVAFSTTDKVFGTGLNDVGQLALGDETDVSTFTQEESGAVNWEEAVAGGNHTMGRKSTGAILGTGENNEGELGLNDTTNRSEFTQESSSAIDWIALFCGGDHTIALKSNNALWGSGDNSHGQLGIGESSIEDLYRQEVKGDTDWAFISCGTDHSIAIKNTGTLWGCGNNSGGQLSTGDKVNKNTFTQEQGLETDWVTSACGIVHTMAIKDDGSLWGAGLNGNGQLGVGNTLDQIIFAREALVANDWSTVSANSVFTMAIKTDGTLYGTGLNEGGQLGLGTTSPANLITFTQEISAAENWDSVAAGNNFSVGTQVTDFFKVISEETVSVNGVVTLDFNTISGAIALGALQASNEVLFQITVDSNQIGDAASIDNLQLRDATATGDNIGIRLDDGSRFWSTIDDILSGTEIVLTDALPSDAGAGNSVFVFDEFIDRPLRLYNGRTQTSGDDNQIPVDEWSRQEYMQQPLKSSQGIPVNMYYTPELKDGRLYVWQTASDVDQLLQFTYDKPFEVTPDTASQPDIPVEWANPLKWAIAKELIPGYGVPVDRAAEIRANAVETLKEAKDNSTASVYDLNVIPDMR